MFIVDIPIPLLIIGWFFTQLLKLGIGMVCIVHALNKFEEWVASRRRHEVHHYSQG